MDNFHMDNCSTSSLYIYTLIHTHTFTTHVYPTP